MTQPSYRPSEGHPMRRFALFCTALLVLVVIGSLPSKGARQHNSMCVCLPTRAKLLMKSVTSLSVISRTPGTVRR
jgi:ABC-type Mn2+/Zn2+ transport system permease subunit